MRLYAPVSTVCRVRSADERLAFSRFFLEATMEDDVRLPESARLPGATSLRAPLSCLNEARFGIRSSMKKNRWVMMIIRLIPERIFKRLSL